MIRWIRSSFVLLALALAACATAYAQPPRVVAAPQWVLLGERAVQFRSDHDAILVGAGAGKFRRIGFQVIGNDIHLADIHVTFSNGESIDVPVRERIRDGGRTRAIDLPGEERHIARIDIVYRSLGRLREGRARVLAFGLL
jgi:hypothetical protein